MVVYSKFIVYIIIENIGPVSAYKISIKFDKEITSVEGDKKISSMKIFDHIEFLLPHKKIRIFLDTFVSYILGKQPLIIEATVIYSNKSNKEFRRVINHDLSIYKYIPQIIRN
jgi:hypothetical protein